MIRRARFQDAGAVLALTREFATSFVTEDSAFREPFTALLQDEAAYLEVAEVQGEVIGYVLAFSHRTLCANGQVAWVEEIMVRPAVRRHGLGLALMDAAEMWAAERGLQAAGIGHAPGGQLLRGPRL